MPDFAMCRGMPLTLCAGRSRRAAEPSLYTRASIEPAARRAGGTRWQCNNRVSSLPAVMPASAGAGTDTAPAFSSGGG